MESHRENRGSKEVSIPFLVGLTSRDLPEPDQAIGGNPSIDRPHVVRGKDPFSSPAPVWAKNGG